MRGSAQWPPPSSPKLPPFPCREQQQRRKEVPAVPGTEAREKLVIEAKCGRESDAVRAAAGKGDCYQRKLAP